MNADAIAHARDITDLVADLLEAQSLGLQLSAGAVRAAHDCVAQQRTLLSSVIDTAKALERVQA